MHTRMFTCTVPTQDVPPLSGSFKCAPAATDDALDLLARLMALNPSHRLTAEQVSTPHPLVLWKLTSWMRAEGVAVE